MTTHIANTVNQYVDFAVIYIPKQGESPKIVKRHCSKFDPTSKIMVEFESRSDFIYIRVIDQSLMKNRYDRKSEIIKAYDKIPVEPGTEVVFATKSSNQLLPEIIQPSSDFYKFKKLLFSVGFVDLFENRMHSGFRGVEEFSGMLNKMYDVKVIHEENYILSFVKRQTDTKYYPLAYYHNVNADFEQVEQTIREQLSKVYCPKYEFKDEDSILSEDNISSESSIPSFMREITHAA
ncbi:MAG TPA: hypothetical protein DCL21_05035 [Alphaproteobacteria bacterium]|nr:hypothetical protein [Alphaproteobacteria bacterium]